MVRCATAVVFGIICTCTTGVAAPTKSSSPPVKTGTFKDLRLTERSPLSTLEESFRRTPRQFTGQKLQTLDEMTPQDRARLDYDLSQESIDVVVPAAPASARDASPYGLLVWLGVSTPDPAWFGALARRKIIFALPNRCDGRSPWLKRGLALDAVHNLSKQYNIDPARVYLGGFSAGAHATSALIVQFPDVFKGTLCLNGGHFYQPAYRPSAQGKRPTPEATILGPAWYGGDVERLKRELRLVSVFGAADDVVPASFGRVDHESLKLDGFQHTYIELPAHGHHYPDHSTFQRALAALDTKAAARPPTTGPTRPNEPPNPDQIAQAKRLLNTAKLMQEMTPHAPMPEGATRGRATLAANDLAFDPDLPRRCLTELLAKYPTTPAAAEARALLATLDASSPSATTSPTTNPTATAKSTPSDGPVAPRSP